MNLSVTVAQNMSDNEEVEVSKDVEMEESTEDAVVSHFS